MTETKHVWSSDWTNQFDDKVHAIGFANLSELLASMPCRPYCEVVNRLGQVAPIQVIAVQYREAKLAKRVRDAAKDGLCRNLVEKLPKGWGIGTDAEWKSIHALSSWLSEVVNTGECPEFEPLLFAVAKGLRDLPPLQGWIPDGPNDTIIKSVFDSHWPVD